jgi:hypothetical protein
VSFESVLAVGWKIGPKPNPILILYAGDTIEPAVEAVNNALDAGLVESARVYRGSGLGGPILFNASVDNRPPNPFEVHPPAGSK